VPDAADYQNQSAFLSVNQTGYAVGWGKPYFTNGNGYQDLYDHETNILPIGYCASLFKNTGDLNSVFCAGRISYFSYHFKNLIKIVSFL
jgi:hypothetical protein